MRHPSAAACRRLLADCGVPPHIRRHSEEVARVARRLTDDLRRHAGARLDRDLVVCGALLHDIAKARTPRKHAAAGARILVGMGLPEVAAIVERHVDLGRWRRGGPVTEAEVLNYSDKRVRHERRVSLTDRFLDLIDRYGRSSPRIENLVRQNWRTIEELEKKIFRRLPFEPDYLL